MALFHYPSFDLLAVDPNGYRLPIPNVAVYARNVTQNAALPSRVSDEFGVVAAGSFDSATHTIAAGDTVEFWAVQPPIDLAGTPVSSTSINLTWSLSNRAVRFVVQETAELAFQNNVNEAAAYVYTNAQPGETVATYADIYAYDADNPNDVPTLVGRAAPGETAELHYETNFPRNVRLIAVAGGRSFSRSAHALDPLEVPYQDIAVPASAGEANTAANVGTAGVGVFKEKAGVQLRFKKLNAANSSIVVTDDTAAGEVDFEVGAVLPGDKTFQGLITAEQDIALPQARHRSLERVAPTTVGHAVNIGSFGLSNGAAAIDLNIVVDAGSYSVAKHYQVPISDHATANAWQRVLPVATTGAYGANDFELDIRVNGGTASFRIRRTGGTTAADYRVSIVHHGVGANTFTPDTGSGAVVAPTVMYAPTYAIGNLSGLNTGDETTATIYTKTGTSRIWRGMYTTLADAAAAAVGKELLFNVNEVVTASIDLSGSRVVFDGDGKISPTSGVTVLLGGMADPGSKQVIGGDGITEFAKGSMPYLDVAWWTGPATSGPVTITANQWTGIVNSVNNQLGGDLYIPLGEFETAGGLNFTHSTTVKGRGKHPDANYGTILTCTTNGATLIDINGGARSLSFENMTLKASVGGKCVDLTGVPGGTFGISFDKVSFFGGDVGLDVTDDGSGTLVINISTSECDFRNQVVAGMRGNTINSSYICDKNYYEPAPNGTSASVRMIKCGTFTDRGSTHHGVDIVPRAYHSIVTYNSGTGVWTAGGNHQLPASPEPHRSLLGNTGGVLPSAFAQQTHYYTRTVSATTFTLHPTAADAFANTNIITGGDTGTGTHTLRTTVPVLTGRPKAAYWFEAGHSSILLENIQDEGIAYSIINEHSSYEYPITSIASVWQGTIKLAASCTFISDGDTVMAHGIETGLYADARVWFPSVPRMFNYAGDLYDSGGTAISAAIAKPYTFINGGDALNPRDLELPTGYVLKAFDNRSRVSFDKVSTQYPIRLIPHDETDPNSVDEWRVWKRDNSGTDEIVLEAVIASGRGRVDVFGGPVRYGVNLGDAFEISTSNNVEMFGELYVLDVAYGPTWNASRRAPSMNAVYDELETIKANTDRGDITTSSGFTVWTIDNDAVTYAKMQNVSAASKLLGRGDSGSGDVQEITIGTGLTMTGTTLSATASGVSDGDKGDITVSGSGATWTIDNDAVTYAKMQNVTATNRFLGRISGGAGDVEELSGTQATTLLDTFTNLLKGLVPASGGGTTNFLRADGWAAPPIVGGGAASRVAYFSDGTTLVTDGDFTFSGDRLSVPDLTLLNRRTFNLSRTLPTTVNDAVNIGSFEFEHGSGQLIVEVTANSSGFTNNKRYYIPARYNGTGNAWQVAVPLTRTDLYNTNDFALDVRQNLGQLDLRIRRTGGSDTADLFVSVVHQGRNADTFTPSTSTASVSAPADFYNQNDIYARRFFVAGGTSYITNTVAGVNGFDFTFPNAGIFRSVEYSLLGTNDIFFQCIPPTTAGYGYLESHNSAGMAVGTSQAVPVLIRPNRADAARFDNSSTAGQTRFLIYDVDNGQLERVTVGAADSGGTGFKVLRIPN